MVGYPKPIDLFTLYVLFSQCRSCKNCFFEISPYSRAYVHIIYEKTKGKSPWEDHMVYIGNLGGDFFFPRRIGEVLKLEFVVNN